MTQKIGHSQEKVLWKQTLIHRHHHTRQATDIITMQIYDVVT